MKSDKNVVLARIRRSGFETAAEGFYLDATYANVLCEDYDLDSSHFLLGIYKDTECWTCLFEKNTYFKNGQKLNTARNSDLLDIMHNALFEAGKDSEIEFIAVHNCDPMWIASRAVACAIQNVLLFVNKS
jgi:hypothetical protein